MTHTHHTQRGGHGGSPPPRRRILQKLYEKPLTVTTGMSVTSFFFTDTQSIFTEAAI